MTIIESLDELEGKIESLKNSPGVASIKVFTLDPNRVNTYERVETWTQETL
jgi:hypothetical protein